MQRTRHSLTLLLLPATVAGCCSHTPTHQTTPTTDQSIFQPQVAPPHAFLHTDTFTTPLIPTAAAGQTEQVFRDTFAFDPASGRGDRFSATTSATTATGQQLKVTFRWRSEHETSAEFQSDLPPDQHAYVLNAIKTSLANASHQPPQFSRGTNQSSESP